MPFRKIALLGRRAMRRRHRTMQGRHRLSSMAPWIVRAGLALRHQEQCSAVGLHEGLIGQLR